MSRFEALFVLLALSCGSRSELDANVSTRPPLRIGIFGRTGLSGDETRLTQWLSSFGSVTRTQTDGAPLTNDTLAAFDVVVLDNLVRDYSAEEGSTFAEWIASGGAVLSLTGYLAAPSDWTRPNSLLAPLGVAYVPPLLLAGPSPDSVGKFAAHPLTTGLSKVVFWGGYAVSHGQGASEIAFTTSDVVAVALEYGAGRVFVWGDEWVEYTSSFSSAQTEQFWSNALGWLRP